MRKTKTPSQRFEALFTRCGQDECWPWRGMLNDKGYGLFWTGPGKADRDKAHRAAWSLNVGPIPDDTDLLHSCDNRKCVNWERHLFLGDQALNMADMCAKLRQVRGHGKGNLLTADGVRFIRSSDAPTLDLADQFLVSAVTINVIRRGDTWRDII